MLDTVRDKVFRVPAGVLVTLPQGTNTDQLVMEDKTAEDALLTAKISDWGRMFGLPPAFALLGTMARTSTKSSSIWV